MKDKKKLIEAALFIAARPMTLAELYHIVGIPKPEIRKILKEMESDYGEHGISVRERDSYFELHIKEELKPHVEHLAPEKDFSKATLQTLSLIAYHNPARQSFVVETRGNRAYEHIKELSSRGFIRLEPEGHTNRISITRKFLDYFGLTSPKELKDYFGQRGIEPPDEEDLPEKDENEPESIEKKENHPPDSPEDDFSEDKKEDAPEEPTLKQEKSQAKKSVNVKDEPYRSPFSDVIKDEG